MASRTCAVVVTCVFGVLSACSKSTPDQHAGAAAAASPLSPPLQPTKAAPAAPVTQSTAPGTEPGAQPAVHTVALDDFDPQPNSAPSTITAQSDGKILLGGNFTRVGDVVRHSLARVLPDGSVDHSFGDAAANGKVIAIVVQPDGKILIGGDFDHVGDQPRHRLARLNADGTLDSSLADANLDDSVWSIAVQTDGGILVAGDFKHVAAVSQSYLARLTTTGQLDGSFADPKLCCNVARVVRLQPDGRILVGGYFSQAGGVSHSYLARYSTNGQLDPSFPDGAATAITAMIVAPDGSIFTNGNYRTSSGPGRVVAKLSANGVLDRKFADFGPDSSTKTLALQADGKLVIGGDFQMVAGKPRHALARLDQNGALDESLGDPAFSLDAANPNGTVNDVLVQGDGKIVAVGTFPLVAGQPHEFVARIVNDVANSSVASAPDFVPSVASAVSTAPDSPSQAIVDVSKINSLKKGESTSQDVRSRFGAPFQQDRSENGQTHYLYHIYLPANHDSSPIDGVIIFGFDVNDKYLGIQVLKRDKGGQRDDPKEKVSIDFNGAKYLLRWTNGTQFEFTPAGQEDLDRWTDMVTLLLFPTAKDADALAQIANATLSRYQDRKGTIIGTGTAPPPGANPGEQFVAAVLPDANFLEFVQSRFLLVSGQGVALLYTHRLYGTRAGNEMSQWMQPNGPLLERQLMNFDAAPLVTTVQGLPNLPSVL